MVSYNDNSTLKRRGDTIDWDETEQRYVLRAGEQIMSLDVYLNPQALMLAPFGFGTNQGKTFKPHFTGARDGIDTLTFTAPPDHALRGFCGRTGECFDRITPIRGYEGVV